MKILFITCAFLCSISLLAQDNRYGKVSEEDFKTYATKFEFNGSEGVFTFISGQTEAMLQIVMSLDLNKALILSSDYGQFKKFYQFLIEKQTEKVVLKKI